MAPLFPGRPVVIAGGSRGREKSTTSGFVFVFVFVFEGGLRGAARG
jgi:hypothetical protein